MSPLDILGLVVGVIVLLNFLLALVLWVFGRSEKRPVRPVKREELIEIHDDWSWPR